ncbi:MAG: hypothetical protein AB7S41_04960 [Parvibaculaceae bacterium]
MLDVDRPAIEALCSDILDVIPWHGLNCCEFNVPALCKRGWVAAPVALGLPPPSYLLNLCRKRAIASLHCFVLSGDPPPFIGDLYVIPATQTGVMTDEFAIVAMCDSFITSEGLDFLAMNTTGDYGVVAGPLGIVEAYIDDTLANNEKEFRRCAEGSPEPQDSLLKSVIQRYFKPIRGA